MILVIDNYDSFTYNLARYVAELGYESRVYRNDQLRVAEIAHEIRPSHILISPGPCTPYEAGISVEVVKRLGDRIPLFGVCLGHQAIAAAYGARIVKAKKPLHGIAAKILHHKQGILAGIANPLIAGRYHSLVVEREGFPGELEIIATSLEGEIMALRHRQYPIYGVQFHVESVLTKQGHEILGNFLRLTARNS